MADIAASVLAKLKNKAKASGISYQQCLQLFFQEEFLRRLAGSKYAENFVPFWKMPCFLIRKKQKCSTKY